MDGGALDALRARIARAAERSGRDPGEVTIVAATKTRTPEEIRAVVAAGIADLGENRVQEFLAKEPLISGARWHLIGPLQRNKVRHVVGRCVLLHAVDSIRLLETIDEEARRIGSVQPILIEVNLDDDPGKHGCSWEALPALLAAAAALPFVSTRGLMGIPDPARDPAAAFRRLREARDRHRDEYPDLAELSMGMSDDLEAAIEAGATLVRPGTALFGPRPS